MSTVTKLSLALLASGTLLGCSTQDRANQGAAMTKTAAATERATSVSEPEIAHIVHTTNDAEIDAAKLALKKSNNKEVRAYAERMIRDHSMMEKQNSRLAKDMSIVPDKNAVSSATTASAGATRSSLEDLNGREFDKAYIDQQVVMHQNTLDNFDSTLIPNARNEDMRSMLVSSREKIAAHLDEATKLQNKLTK